MSKNPLLQLQAFGQSIWLDFLRRGMIASGELRLRNGTRLATTLGYGPRFLHSTGQYHKGAPPRDSSFSSPPTTSRTPRCRGRPTHSGY